MSIGLTRLFYILNEMAVLGRDIDAPADVLVIPMTEDLAPAIRISASLRAAGIRTQIYMEKKKFKAKIGYADKLHVPYALFLGEDEIREGKVAVKDMTTGEQQTLTLEALIEMVNAAMAIKAAQPLIVEQH